MDFEYGYEMNVLNIKYNMLFILLSSLFILIFLSGLVFAQGKTAPDWPIECRVYCNSKSQEAVHLTISQKNAPDLTRIYCDFKNQKLASECNNLAGTKPFMKEVLAEALTKCSVTKTSSLDLVYCN